MELSKISGNIYAIREIVDAKTLDGKPIQVSIQTATVNVDDLLQMKNNLEVEIGSMTARLAQVMAMLDRVPKEESVEEEIAPK